MSQGTILSRPATKWAALAALVAVLAVLLTASVVRAQADNMTIKYAENNTDPVATFTGTDPEGATPIEWFIAAAGTDHDGNDGPLVIADAADAEDFDIDKKTGALTFDVGGDAETPDMSVAPDFENPGDTGEDNTYNVVVAACDVALDASDACTGGITGYHKVTVMVTKVDETGKVTLAATAGVTTGTPQYLVGTTLTATASDGDIKHTTADPDQDFIADTTDQVSGVTWRWYRGGSQIDGAETNVYVLTTDDANQHIRAVVYYIVAGNVNQEMAEKTTDHPVLAARVGTNQLKFDPATVSMSISEGDKDRNVGAPVTATGNHGTVEYSLDDTSGDALTASPKFKIGKKTGQITTAVELNYEADAAAADNCATKNRCEVTVIATDSTGDTTTGTAPNLRATVTIMITDVDEKPTFTSGYMVASIMEGTTVVDTDADGDGDSTTGGSVYEATDPEGLTVTYSLAGPDASKFHLSGNPPVLSFVSKPDFEAKASADGDNVYEVTVRASAGGQTGERTVRVTVSNVNEAPDVSGLSTRSFPENGTDPVATFTGTDPEGATPIEWFIAAAGTDHDGNDGPLVIADAADAEDFDIDKKTGALTFDVGGDAETPDMSVAPDFENPGDTGEDNTYNVVVAACDVALDASDACTGGITGYHKVTVMVTKVDERGKVTFTTDTEPQYLVGATLTATASDGDIKHTTADPDQDFTGAVTDQVSGVTWRWYRGGSPITGAEANVYVLTTDDANQRIRVVVRYQVEGNTNQEMAEKTTDYPVLAARVRSNQLKFDPATVSMTISEGDKDRNVGAPVTATGNHGSVRYSLDDTSGDALTASPKFKIGEKTGQITTAVDLDYEADAAAADNCATKNSCEVTVTATDATGEAATNSATVTITITNVDEKPDFSTGAKTVGVPENSTDLFGAATDGYSAAGVTGDVTVAAVTYTAADPEGRTVSYSLAGPDASKFRIRGNPPVLSFASGPDFEAKASADGDNVYEVTVRASVGNDAGERMVRVTVSNVNEAPEIIEGALDIAGSSSEYFDENSSDAVAMFTAKGTMREMARWTLEGADAMYFEVSPARGAMTDLMFRSAPDYEMPRGMAKSDANTNTYMVILKASDGTNEDTHNVTVMVANVDEDGTVTLSSMAPVVGDELTATLMDDDGMMSATWQWSKSMDSTFMDGTEMDIANATSMAYTPMEADVDYYLRATATYTDAHGSQTAMDTTDMAVVANRAPVFAEDMATLTIAEGSAAETAVGDPVTATDPDGDTLAYTLEGADAASFDIDNMGQIMVGAGTMLDYETKMSYMVTVKATDPDGLYDTIAVTINVTDVDELLAKFDTNGNGSFERSEVIDAITRYLNDEVGVTRAEVIAVITRYLEN